MLKKHFKIDKESNQIQVKDTKKLLTEIENSDYYKDLFEVGVLIPIQDEYIKLYLDFTNDLNVKAKLETEKHILTFDIQCNEALKSFIEIIGFFNNLFKFIKDFEDKDALTFTNHLPYSIQRK